MIAPEAGRTNGEMSPEDTRRRQEHSLSDFKPGLEGVIAFETEIAEPDRDGGALRYRGVDIEDLVGEVSFGNVWGLLVDGEFAPGLPPAEPFRSGTPRTFGWTYRARPRCSRRRGAFGSSWTSTSSKPGRTSPVRR